MTIINYGIPNYRLRIFTTEYSPSGSIGTDVADSDMVGWLEFRNQHMYLSRFDIQDDIRQKSVMNFTIDSDYRWLFTLDMVALCDYTAYYPKSSDGQTLVTGGSRLVVMISGATDSVGTVTISGTVGGSSDSEVFTISGEGAYIGTKVFTAIDASGIVPSGLTCDVSVWGQCDSLTDRKREIQFWVDGNNDGVYGKIFGGYMTDMRHNPVYGRDSINYVCNDYTDFLMGNAFGGGFRTYYRCSNYQYGTSGQTCDELANTVGWFGTYCRSGDMHPSHPQGQTVTEDNAVYSCSYYSASTDKLPFCGWSFNSDYAPDTDAGYEYYPEDYTRGILSIANISNHLEGTNKSDIWRPASKAYFELNGALTDSATSVPVNNYTGWGIEEGDYIYVGTEFMYVSSSPFNGTSYYNSGSGTLTVTRAALNSEASAYSDNVPGVLFYVSTAVMGVTGDDPIIIESDVSSSIYSTGKRYAETMTLLTESRECVFWVDYNRQLHLMEVNAENPAYSGSLTLTDDDVLAVEGLSVLYSGIINHVVGDVTTATENSVPASLSSDNVTGITNSISRFGLHVGVMDTTQINSLASTHSYANNRRAFLPCAESYLKTHAYPLSQQTVKVMNFYPDEWHWNTATEYHTPLNYTDPYHEYIDIKGHQIECADYNFPDRPVSTFVVESFKYEATEYGDSECKIKMTRLTTETDWDV